MAKTLAEALNHFISNVAAQEKLKASFLISGLERPEVHVILDHHRPAYTVENIILEGFDCKLVKSDSRVFESDVERGALLEILAGRLLLPIERVYGAEYMEGLELRYKTNVVKRLVGDLVSEHKIASLELRIRPEYFLYEKVRRLSAVFPHIRRDFIDCYGGGRVVMVMTGFMKALDKLVAEGFLERLDGYYRISEPAYRKFSDIPPLAPSKLSQQLREYFSRPLLTKVALQLFLGTAGQWVRTQATSVTPLPDPEAFLAINTGLGLQPLTFQLEVVELVKHLYGGVQTEIRRKGGLLNSTYVLTVKENGFHRLFVKKYLNWTDLKWLAARIWAAWVKNFSINPSTRLATEIFFLDQLKNLGFKTPEVIHVNWRRKILFTTFLEGENLLELWLRGDEGRGEFARKVGSCLARIHSKGIMIGDCKPESFMRVGEDVYVTDLEQASFSADRSWDLMELIYYPGHYLDAEEAASFAGFVVEGYLSDGRPEDVAGAIKPKYLRIIAPWTPIWVQRTITDVVRSRLRA